MRRGARTRGRTCMSPRTRARTQADSHTYTHAYTRTCTRTPTHTRALARRRRNLRALTLVRARTDMRALARECACVDARTYARAHEYAHARTRTCERTDMLTHPYAHTRTNVRADCARTHAYPMVPQRPLAGCDASKEQPRAPKARARSRTRARGTERVYSAADCACEWLYAPAMAGAGVVGGGVVWCSRRAWTPSIAAATKQTCSARG